MHIKTPKLMKFTVIFKVLSNLQYVIFYERLF